MGRRIEKTEYVSHDTLQRLSLYSRGNLSWLYAAHNEFLGLGVQNFYALMRGDAGTPENVKRFEDLDQRLKANGTYDSLKLSLG